MERFYRTERLIGRENLERLIGSRVAVVGLGAVGGYAVEGLARLGVGGLLLIDHDRVSVSNINRQLYALDSTVGEQKTAVAERRVLDINPSIRVDTLELFIDGENRGEILSWEPDLVIDAIDSLSPKVELLAEMYRRGIPIVSSMGAALRRDPSKVLSGDIFDTKHCPMARKIRGMLRKRAVARGIDCVYSLEIPDFSFRSPREERYQEEPGPEGRERRLLGSLSTVTGIFGLTLAQLAMEKLIHSA